MINAFQRSKGNQKLANLQAPWQNQVATNLEDGSDEEERSDVEEEEHEAGEIFADYRPIKLPFGRPHPDAAVETASLAAVEPPDITYKLHIQDLVDEGKLSGLQLESIVYACQRHEQLLPSGDRCGFFIGDGKHGFCVFILSWRTIRLLHQPFAPYIHTGAA